MSREITATTWLRCPDGSIVEGGRVDDRSPWIVGSMVDGVFVAGPAEDQERLLGLSSNPTPPSPSPLQGDGFEVVEPE